VHRQEWRVSWVAQLGSKLDVQKLPPVSDLAKFVGTKEGEIRLFRNEMNPEVYVWKAQSEKWEKMGDVMGPAPSEKDYYEGDDYFPAGYYDYIFNIDIKSKGEKKLPFNKGGRDGNGDGYRRAAGGGREVRGARKHP
jgi:hypothetical protein